jgi:excisionase family DNA binding protein
MQRRGFLVVRHTDTMNAMNQQAYLSLSEASRLLGVHATTLRRWADAGMIRVYFTPGGHRRFALADVEALSEGQPRHKDALAATWARRAVVQARTSSRGSDDMPSWLANLDEAERERWRMVGVQLMGVVLRYINALPDEQTVLLDEARSIGAEYATHALHSRLPLSTALEVALFFRDSLVDAALSMPEQANIRAEASARLLRQISQVLNVVKLAVVAGYEARGRDDGNPALNG